MQATIEFNKNQLKSLMLYTHAKKESEAMNKAIEDYLQRQKLKSI
jgi:hypothetical protein